MIFIQNGYGKYCIDMEVNDISAIAIPCKYYVEVSRAALAERLTREDLQGMTKEQLRLARNELFARYGTIFGVADLADYFGSKSWYTAKISFDEFYENVEMNEIEEANLALILQVEEETE